ncbi:hypothetical protein [Succinimonas sp.]|uniref:hypothetical protein n=1 Tax=Succinimonas sp. TaxID=1936151 RepID=UPI0038666B33
MRKQSGVALIVALMITVIIGLIAVSLAGLAFRSQKAANLSYESVVSDLQAISGVNRVISFLNQVADDENKSVYLKEASSVHQPVSTTGWNIKGKTVDANVMNVLKTTLFNGVDRPMDEYSSTYLDYANGDFWYRDNNGWNTEDGLCVNCVSIDNGRTIVRIEKRGFASTNAGGSAAKIGYQFYRITSRGSDAEGAQSGTPQAGSSQSIVQTNFGILGVQ